MDDLIRAITMIASSLAGAIIAFWVTRATTREQQFFAAAAKLTVAFSEELSMLHHPDNKFTNSQILDRLDTAFEKHLLAITEFRYALPVSKRGSYNKAWCNYYSNYPDCKYVLLTKYSEAVTPKWKNDAIENIETILSFVENDRFSIWYKKIF